MSDSFILLQQVTSTSNLDFNNPIISWIECVRYSFWPCRFCNLISFSSLAFSTLPILYGRISFGFFYFLILPCLLYLAILTKFYISDFDFWFKWLPLFLMLNIMTPDTAIAESVGFCAFFGHTMQNLSQILCLLLDSSANLTLFLY